MTVRELLERTTSQELAEWMAYDRLDPFSEERADLRSGIIASIIANVNRDPKSTPQPFTAQDFMPKFQGER